MSKAQLEELKQQSLEAYDDAALFDHDAQLPSEPTPDTGQDKAQKNMLGINHQTITPAKFIIHRMATQ